MIEQDIPSVCPECNIDLNMDNILEIGDYPLGGYRNSMKPNQTKAIIYECPKCFAKSCCHVGFFDINLFNSYKKLKIKKEIKYGRRK